MTLSTGRDIALVILILEAFVFVLVPLAALWYAIRGLRQLRRLVEPIFPKAQAVVAKVAASTKSVSEAAVQPVIAIGSLRAQTRAVAQTLCTARKAPPVPDTSGELAHSRAESISERQST